MDKMAATFSIYLAIFTVVSGNECLNKSDVVAVLKHEYLKVAEAGIGICMMDGGRTLVFKKFQCIGDRCDGCIRIEDVYEVKTDCEQFYYMKDEDRKPVEKAGCLSLQSIDSILLYEYRMSYNSPCILREGRTSLFEEYSCAKHSDDPDDRSVKDVECFYCMKQKDIDAMASDCKTNYSYGENEVEEDADDNKINL